MACPPWDFRSVLREQKKRGTERKKDGSGEKEKERKKVWEDKKKVLSATFGGGDFGGVYSVWSGPQAQRVSVCLPAYLSFWRSLRCGRDLKEEGWHCHSLSCPRGLIQSAVSTSRCPPGEMPRTLSFLPAGKGSV